MVEDQDKRLKRLMKVILEKDPIFNIRDRVCNKSIGPVWVGTVIGVLASMTSGIDLDTFNFWEKSNNTGKLRYVYQVYFETPVKRCSLEEWSEARPDHIEEYDNLEPTHVVYHPEFDLELVE